MQWRRTRASAPGPGRKLAELESDYRAACEAGDVEREIAALEALTASCPTVSWAWYDLGLRMKWLRQWRRSREANLRALELLEDPTDAPEAWNLGIAATALSDWATARRAWTAFGVSLPDGAVDEPINGDFGATPIRLNPEPRFAEPALTIDGQRYQPEVVWTTRLCPARGRIDNVPLPESGHRHGDVVLHDGDPVGERRSGDSVRAVFNEIALLERGPHPTITTVIDLVADDEFDRLQESFDARGFAIEAWTRSTQLLCRRCSEGTVDADHDHDHGHDGGEARADTLTLGIAAPVREAETLLDAWLEPRGIDRGPLLSVDG